jgi:predicted HicB family RNase H-like nuclease
MLAVTMRPELFERAHAAAAKHDMPLTTWVRLLVEAELKRLSN